MLKNLTKLILLSLFFGYFAGPSYASSTKDFSCGDEGFYTVNLANATVISNKGCRGSLDIDPSIKVIGPKSFAGNTGITSIHLPSSVVSVESYAFTSDTAVVTVKLSEGLREIHPYAFSGLSKLVNIQLPDTLEFLGDGAFANTPIS